ncbi:hypothetical protein [Bacteroides sp.]|uniref:hypothetical protein n=1 Tax=Bacteroides sp. TaxID=29523 RepID=UPI002633EC01|nr:hypothetical protein [Bacteroides sp.]MDD3040034.1 hypothetical protein [Bacteroides sp.]
MTFFRNERGDIMYSYAMAIREFFDSLDEVCPLWPRIHFQARCYEEWAIDEVIEILEENDELEPIPLVEEFIKKMDEYSCYDEKTSFMFSTAKDTAECILDLLLTYY